VRCAIKSRATSGIRPSVGSLVPNIQGRMNALPTKMRQGMASLVNDSGNLSATG
jgi:molybdopterin biosynthesis enzyme MoaB